MKVTLIEYMWVILLLQNGNLIDIWFLTHSKLFQN